jgi:hypothetical protein
MLPLFITRVSGAMDRGTHEIVPWPEVTSKRDDKPLGNKSQHSPKTEDQSLRMTAIEDSRSLAATRDS